MHSTTTAAAATTRDSTAADGPDAFSTPREMENGHYKSGELLEAIEQYTLACAANPTSALLRFDLSAAQFETGQYAASLQSTRAGIELCGATAAAVNDDGDGGELLAKLWLHRARCELHLRNYRAAGEAAKQVSRIGRAPESTRRDAEELVNAVEVAIYYHSLLSEEEALRIVFEVPKYRPKLEEHRSTNVLEYYNLGHDVAQSQFDPSTDSAGATHSFFFSRVGDSRHLFATIVAISHHELSNESAFQQTRPSSSQVKYHFTVNDIKAHAAARNVLMLLLMHQLAIFGQDQQQAKTDTLALLYYIYLGVLMPARVHGHLQEFIQTTRTALTIRASLPSWLWISQRDCLKIIEILDSWVEPMFPVTHAQAQIAEAERVMPQGEKPKGCEREWTAYRRTGALFPPMAIRCHESELDAFLAGGPGVGGPGMAAWEAGLRAYVGREWKVNMTLVDREWCTEAGVWDVSFDPFSFVEMLYGKVDISLPQEPTQLYDYFEPLFMNTANSLNHFGGIFKVELNVGDCCGALEEIRYGSKVSRRDVERPMDFPRIYDTIHLSNLPDYTGGHLSPVLYALPVLKDAPHAHITSICQVNPPLWQSIEDYVAEYVCLPTLDRLQAATCLRLCPGQDERLHEFMPMSEYTCWQHSTSKTLSYKELLPRTVFTRWLLTLFFKFAVPPNSESRSMAKVYSPLNLSAWVRLLGRVVEIGYPPHWVSSLVEDILANRVMTTIRPPEITPIRIPELEKEHPPQKISTSPFIPELEVLLCTWARVSPFTIVSPAHIPPPEKIYEYSFTILAPQFRDEFVNCLMLKFYPERILEELYKTGHGKRKTCVREMLSSTGRRSPNKCAMREAAIAIGTWWWDKKTRRVTFRLKEGWIEGWQEEDKWVAALWRLDDWTMCSAPTSLGGGNLQKSTLPWGERTKIGCGEAMEMD
ncbi:uncharacterized protein H6S33_001326 [Morchella sextelata]|uniref:uncharacterized protein n=1 Tax=Morchella sextelata TaxID=1174677 RepID=UPI001D04B68B|nr:uncharacterized protein H6S33_001326 [Morchella sextelata]KAH0609098.1 hypothetical protein H6S33_001326 [Morchella sextelata]